MTRDDAEALAGVLAQVRRLIPDDEPFQKVIDAVAAHQGRWLSTRVQGVRIAHFMQRASRGRPNNFESSRPDLAGADLEDAFNAGWIAHEDDEFDTVDQAYTEWRRSV